MSHDLARLLGVAVLHIKDFPEGLQRRLRVAAAQRDETIKALVEQAIAELLERLEREGVQLPDDEG